MKEIKIRNERPEDWKEVEILTRKAFWREKRIEEIGIGAVEHYMVHYLRQNEGISELSFVAEIDQKIVGYVIFSEGSYILMPNGDRKSVLNLGPLGVLPEFQKQGIGSALIKHSIKCARELGYGAIFFFGSETYYPRFGFKEAKQFNVTDCWGENYPTFMGMELKKGYLEGVSGKFIEATIYDESTARMPARVYDIAFEMIVN